MTLPYIADAGEAAAAAELMLRFGAGAEAEAAARAVRSRELGNVVRFCRWRQIERLVALFSEGRGGAALH